MAVSTDDETKIGRHRVRLTHPERVLFPEDGVTKGDLAKYYVEIGDAIVPHLRKEPADFGQSADNDARQIFVKTTGVAPMRTRPAHTRL